MFRSFLNPGGYFLFDVNTIYKHREVLGNNAFIYEQENLFCAWQNSYVEKGHRVDIKLDFFCPRGDGLYARQEESFANMLMRKRIWTVCCLKPGWRSSENMMI